MGPESIPTSTSDVVRRGAHCSETRMTVARRRRHPYAIWRSQKWKRFWICLVSFSGLLYLIFIRYFEQTLSLGKVAVETSGQGQYTYPTTFSSGKHSSRELQIPRIIHHTFKSHDRLSRQQIEIMSTWKTLNPDWKVMEHNDAKCRLLVQTHYPSFFAVYESLPKNVERADFFRYLILYHYGGFYADIDVESRAPLDSWIGGNVSLIIGIENEFSSEAEATVRSYARTRQYQQWAMASSKGHPLFLKVLLKICERVRHDEIWGIDLSNRGTLERTGPAIWTDSVTEYLRETLTNLLSISSYTERAPNVTFSDVTWILPRVYTAAFPNGADIVDPRHERSYILHHFLGGWKSSKKKSSKTAKESPLLAHTLTASVLEPPVEFGHPVSILIPRLAGVGHTLASGHLSVTVFAKKMVIPLGFNGLEDGATLSSWGTWQGSASPGDSGGILITHATFATPFIAAGTRSNQLQFVEVGSSTGVISLSMAKLGVSSLSVTTKNDAARIKFSAFISGCTKTLTISESGDTKFDVISDFMAAQRDQKVTGSFHFEGVSGIKAFHQVLRSDMLGQVHLITALFSREHDRNDIRTLLDGVYLSDHAFVVQHSGRICRTLTESRERSFFFRWMNIPSTLSRKLAKMFIRARAIGPELSVLKHSFYTEPRCTLSHFQVKHFTSKYFDEFPTNERRKFSGDSELFVIQRGKRVTVHI